MKNIKTCSIVIVVMTFLCQSQVLASVNNDQVKSFLTTSSDTVQQGETFEVKYILTSKSWKSGIDIPKSQNGFVRSNVKYASSSNNPYSTLIITASYSTSQAGQQELPIVTIPVGDDIVSSTKKVVFVKANKEYGEEMAYAHRWLLEHGQHPDSLSLQMTSDDEGFWVFSDKRNKCFCIVADKDVWPLIGVPVLAYSRESALYSQHNGSRQHNGMVNTYRVQIANLRKEKVSPFIPSLSKTLSSKAKQLLHKLYMPKHQEVKPLLSSTRWNQRNPYNLFAPTIDGKKAFIGCVPLAVAQVMSYYQWPEVGNSHTYYKYINDKIIKLDFSASKPQWKSYKDAYAESDSTDESAKNLSKLLTFLALALDAKFKDDGTSACLENVKHILCNNLGYSGHATFYDNLTESQTEALLYKELDEKRPCIVSNSGHAFVCDGYRDDFFHYNLGWGGHYNGYYRLLLGNSRNTNNKQIIIKYLICGIEPQLQDTSFTKEIILKKAGTLEKTLSDQEKESITNLTIKGPINSQDIKLIRRMAGANDELLFEGWRGGALCELNLREARIVNDKNSYSTRLTTGTWTVTEGNGNKITYTFPLLSEKQWKKFQAVSSRWKGIFFTRTDDNRYREHYCSQENVIGQRMFASCTSLRSIILPLTTEKVDHYAFSECSSLLSIVLPPNTESIGKDPFYRCLSLEEVLIPANTSSQFSTICRDCSPILRTVTRY